MLKWHMIKGVTLLPYMEWTIRTITVTKCFGGEMRRPKVLMRYNYQNGITNEEEDIIFTTKPELFSIWIINLLETIQSVKNTDVEIMDNSVKTNNSKFKSMV